ncbi:glycosyltransferase family 4 protein [Leucobacter sp. wl10]|uniref:glycosyltransferase family 4 protein n=1 Tax=Leucobacter sp. wl10 TaxID=2304677 RepID=UPI000E5B1CDF|nr:glycosyltransferase family 4 protein [Leucobacter sp. wl10]RGE20510.1 glycosyltransferase [Leucobacter sp. wl10]
MTAPQTVLAVHPGAELFGSDRMFLESVIGLREAGLDVVVALPERGPLVPRLQAAGARVVLIPMLVLRKALLRPSGWGTLARDGIRGLVAAHRLLSRVRPAAVYVSTITLPHWPVVARLRRARVVGHVHEAEESINRWVSTAAYLPLAAAHAVIVNSEYSRETLVARLPALAARSTVIHNGVEGPDDPEPPRADLSGPMRVCYVGRLSPRKGPDLLLDAARLLAQAGAPVQITLVGSVFPGNEWYERELRETADALPDGADARFVGFDPDIWPHLAAGDAVIVPSRLDESFGNTAVEGVLALRPVVAGDIRGLREAVGDYASAVLVAPGDARALADALASLRMDWPSLRASVADARTRALARHAPSMYRASIGRAVAEAAGGRAGAPPSAPPHAGDAT